MTTERDFRYIVDDVYAVDSLKVKVPLKEGAIVAQGKFKIITPPVDNTSNGMQGRIKTT
ncbi:hypothetical protein QM965_10515 [Streptococcus oralis subsp. tigurinus]|uniref:hypothetical protein n=1 Tax=Streptococcus oralis TaxID=1303 RepID=UPI0039C09548